ncbi:MAG: hypothetical protein RR247_00840 [Clostridia bacterium]
MKKIFILFSVLMVAIIFSGCTSSSDQASVTSKLSKSLNETSATLSKVDTITNETLAINEIMDDALAENSKTAGTPSQNTGYNGATFTNGYTKAKGRYVDANSITYNNFGSYVTKLQDLHFVASDVISANSTVNILKSQILSKTSALKSLVNDMEQKTITLNEKQCKAIYDLVKNADVNVNRIRLTKSEVNNELSGVKLLKNNYTANVDQLNSKYTRLLNSLDIRASYYANLLTCLDSIYNCIISGKCDVQSATDSNLIIGIQDENLTNNTSQNKTNLDTASAEPYNYSASFKQISCNDGTCAGQYPDGTCYQTTPNGNCQYYCADGSCYYVCPDGTCKNGICPDCNGIQPNLKSGDVRGQLWQMALDNLKNKINSQNKTQSKSKTTNSVSSEPYNYSASFKQISCNDGTCAGQYPDGTCYQTTPNGNCQYYCADGSCYYVCPDGTCKNGICPDCNGIQPNLKSGDVRGQLWQMALDNLKNKINSQNTNKDKITTTEAKQINKNNSNIDTYKKGVNYDKNETTDLNANNLQNRWNNTSNTYTQLPNENYNENYPTTLPATPNDRNGYTNQNYYNNGYNNGMNYGPNGYNNNPTNGMNYGANGYNNYPTNGMNYGANGYNNYPGNGGYGFGYNGYYPNINTYYTPRNINTYGGFRNTDTYKNSNNNINTYGRTEQNNKTNFAEMFNKGTQPNKAQNPNDPYRVFPKNSYEYKYLDMQNKSAPNMDTNPVTRPNDNKINRQQIENQQNNKQANKQIADENQQNKTPSRLAEPDLQLARNNNIPKVTEEIDSNILKNTYNTQPVTPNTDIENKTKEEKNNNTASRTIDPNNSTTASDSYSSSRKTA